MTISNIISCGSLGLQAGFNRSEAAAGRIARAGGEDKDGALTAAMVDLRISEVQAKAAASVIRTGDQLLGTLIDLRG